MPLKVRLGIICFLIQYIVVAQMSFPFQGKVGVGAAAYHGDLCSGIACIRPNFALNLGLKYFINPHFSFVPEAGVYRINAKDENGANPERNLSFRSTNMYASVNLRYDFMEYYFRSPTKIWPYISLGVGAAYFNPKAELDDEWIALQPLQTEGESYSRYSFFVPIEFGVGWKTNESITIGVSYNWSLYFTDYLDDVSGEYVDNQGLSGNAAILADRTAEGGYTPTQSTDNVHWEEGASRGNSSFPDHVSRINFFIAFDIYRSGMICP